MTEPDEGSAWRVRIGVGLLADAPNKCRLLAYRPPEVGVVEPPRSGLRAPISRPLVARNPVDAAPALADFAAR